MGRDPSHGQVMKDSKITVYVVEDDPSIRFGLEEILNGEGFEVHSCETGGNAIEGIGETLPDLILLDVMLPEKSGYEIAKELRKNGSRIPVLMLTARGQEMDKVIGLNSGADDYVTKPFGVNELLARINALLRRTQEWGRPSVEADSEEDSVMIFGDAEIDRNTYEARIAGQVHPLTPREMELICFIHQHRGVVLTRDRLLEEVWGVKYFGTTRTLDQCIAQVRKKIGDEGRTPKYLLTVHGVGYKMAQEVVASE